MRVSANGGSASPLTTLDPSRGEIRHVLPSFLPDGRHFIYLRYSSRPENSGVYVGSLDAKPEEQSLKRLLADTSKAQYVPSSGRGAGYLVFARDEALVALQFDEGRWEPTGEAFSLAEEIHRSLGGLFYSSFSASGNGVLAYMGGGGIPLNQLTWFDRQGKVQGTASEPTLNNSLVLSPDGGRAFTLDSSGQNSGLWMLDFARGTTARFTFGSSPAGEDANDAVWSLDGKRVIFVSSRDGTFASFYEKPASGTTDEVLLLKSADVKHPRSLSPDGRFLFYDGFDPTTGKSGIWTLPLEGDKKPVPPLQAEFDEGGAQISPDGKWMAYASDESGLPEVFVRAFSPPSAGSSSSVGGKWPISSGGGTDARWRRDGKELYYLTQDSKVMAVELTTSPTFQAGPPKELFQGPPLFFPFGVSRPSQWGVTADGKRFLFPVPKVQTASAAVTVVLNWQAGLKK